MSILFSTSLPPYTHPDFPLPSVFLGVIEVKGTVAVVVIGDQHFSVLIGPEAVEVDQDAGDRVALATVDQVLQGDLVRVFRFHHVEDLILKDIEGQHIGR